MIKLSGEILQISKEQDVILLRNRIKETANRIGMGLVSQTKLITAASELVRNMLEFANGGKTTIDVVSVGRKTGIRIIFADNGPGIADLDLAMKDGYSTRKSLGLGLPGARRLVNDFQIKSVVGEGTTVTVIQWKNG
jgi:serine/threonine-protein kinase RsbT